MPDPQEPSTFDLWIATHCYDCGHPHTWHGGHDHCFDERNGPRPQDGCECGGCQYARGIRFQEADTN